MPAAHQVHVGEAERAGHLEQVAAALRRQVHVAAVAARGGGDEEHRLRLDERAQRVVDLVEDLGHQPTALTAPRHQDENGTAEHDAVDHEQIARSGARGSAAARRSPRSRPTNAITVATATLPSGSSPRSSPAITSLSSNRPLATTAGHREQEREPAAAGRSQPEQQARAHRRARARDARDQRQRLREPDQEAVARRQLRDLALVAAVPVGVAEHEREHDQHRPDQPQVRARRSRSRRGRRSRGSRSGSWRRSGTSRAARPDRAQERVRGAAQPLVAIAHSSWRKKISTAASVPSWVTAVNAAPGSSQPSMRRDDPLVGARGDRQELGEPLHDPEDDRLDQVSRPREASHTPCA